MIAAGAVSGSSPSPLPTPPELSIVNMLVPSPAILSSRSERDESDSPSTPTIAAIPIAMPSADSAVRNRRVRNPSVATEMMSPIRIRLYWVERLVFTVLARSLVMLVRVVR